MIYRYSNMLLEVILLLCSFHRVIESFLLRSMTYLFSGSCLLQQCQLQVPSHGVVFKSNFKMWLVASIALVSLLYQCILQAGAYFRSEGSQLNDIDDYFSLLAVCMVPSQHHGHQSACSGVVDQHKVVSNFCVCVCAFVCFGFFGIFFIFFQVLWSFFLREIT